MVYLRHMRVLQNRVLMLRVLGLTLLSAVVCVGGHLWRESLVSQGSYLASAYDTANFLQHAAGYVWAAGSVFCRSAAHRDTRVLQRG
jgi:hypothetical protein